MYSESIFAGFYHLFIFSDIINDICSLSPKLAKKINIRKTFSKQIFFSKVEKMLKILMQTVIIAPSLFHTITPFKKCKRNEIINYGNKMVIELAVILQKNLS